MKVKDFLENYVLAPNYKIQIYLKSDVSSDFVCEFNNSGKATLVFGNAEVIQWKALNKIVEIVIKEFNSGCVYE